MSEVQDHRQFAALCRRAAGIPTQGGHLTDNILLAFADKLERKAEKLEVGSTTPLALDTSEADGQIPPDLAELQLEPESPTHIDHVAIAWAALEALPPKRRRKVLTASAARLGYRLHRARHPGE
jgi:hypothetical protein